MFPDGMRPDGNNPYVLADGGEMGAVMRAMDWAKTPLGPIDGWSQALRTTVGILLRNRFPMLLWWGPQFVQLYNDAYRPIPGAKHPKSMGQPGSECWAEIWHIIGPMVEAPYAGAPATFSDDLDLLMDRHGFLEETHFKVAYSPVPDETVQPTGIGGVLATVAETTAAVFGERQLRTLRELGEHAADAKTPEQACAQAAATLAANPRDVPFAAFYLLDETGRIALLADSWGLGQNPEVAPPTIALDGPSPWPLAEVAAQRTAALVPDLRTRFAALPCGAWAEPPSSAIVLPLASPEQPHVHGFFIAAQSPHRAMDDLYRGFFELAAAQVVTAIRNASAHQEARRRVEALAAIDRAKTEFFSNVSHEFRTPLTLMLGPTKDALDSDGALAGEALQVVYRNELRLLKLVNNLLDFARIEANRTQASYRPTDLAALTTDLASGFRAAIEGAGVALRVSCPPLGEPAFVDRDMWEKIVLNLLSNAFKFTFEGSIDVKLEARGESLLLTVADTGTGIPEHELPHLFDRFHRVSGARGRTHEGSGIGLALVQDLVRMHHGTVAVTSRVGAGSAFTVSIPRGQAHLPADRIGDDRAPAPVSARADAYLAEAARWLPDEGARTPPPVIDASSARILLADDNADMRDYVRRILERRWQVETVADGAEALAAAERNPPDLILTDVMMPAVDGFGLVQAVRARAALATIPVIMLSARAGDEARVDGLAAGADDYLVKPFSARELVARVEGQLKLRRQTRAAEEARVVAEEATRAKDEFMAMLGHELRNPLAPILTTLQVMKLRASGLFEAERALIDRQVRHVVRLVEDLLEVSRIARGKISLDRVPVDLGDAIARAIELASPLLEQRRHHLTVDVDDGLVLEGDKMRLSQVFANLLTNAAKYTPSGGTIVVSAKRLQMDDGEMLRVSVKDTGIGMRAEMLPAVFDLFVQGRQGLDRSEGGLGLGLSIVKSLVTLHHGTVEAHSAGPGKGSEFVLLLPAAPASVLSAAAASAAVAEVARAHSSAGRRVLVVDDNEDAAASLAEALVDLGHQVEVAHDGPEALAKLESFSPEIALLDIGLPLMDGYELARRIRHEPQLSGIRLVSITGYGQPSDRVRAAEAGFDVHLVKPVELGDIERAIADAPN
jgi:signal transduction histidine kinase